MSTTEETAVDEVLERDVARIIAGVLKVDSTEIQPEVDLRERFQLDSLQALQVLAAIENAFDIEVPEEEMELASTLRGIATTVAKLRE